MSNHPLLKNVKPAESFYLSDGTSISGLRELARRLPSLPKEAFSHHVSATKNDFHSWVSHVIKDTHLSKDIKEVKDQREMAALVSKRVAELEARDARKEISEAVAKKQMAAPAPAGLASSLFSPKSQSAPSSWRPAPAALPSPSMRLSGTSSGAAPFTPSDRWKPLPSSEPLESKVAPPRGAKPASAKPITSPSASTRPASNAPPSPSFKPLSGVPRRGRPLIPAIKISASLRRSVQAGSSPARKSSPPKDTVPSPRKGKGKASALSASVQRSLARLGPVKPADSHHAAVPSSIGIPPPPSSISSMSLFSKSAPISFRSADVCDHSDHFACVRCGMMEFGVGLLVGAVSILMFAKAFF